MMIELIFAIALPFIKMYRLIFEKQTKKEEVAGENHTIWLSGSMRKTKNLVSA